MTDIYLITSLINKLNDMISELTLNYF